MSRITVYVVVEGPTEQTFIQDVLAPWISNNSISMIPVLIGKSGQKGGDVRFERIKANIKNLLRRKDFLSRNDIYISTMLDYFRIELTWPGRANVLRQVENGTSLTSSQKAKVLEDATYEEIKHCFPECGVIEKFIPYIEMHEFEVLLFSDPEVISEKTGIREKLLTDILAEYNNPEDINNTPEGAPSKRLLALKKDYRKIVMGKTIAETIGITKIRAKCPHFDNWLTLIEQKSDSQS